MRRLLSAGIMIRKWAPRGRSSSLGKVEPLLLVSEGWYRLVTWVSLSVRFHVMVGLLIRQSILYVGLLKGLSATLTQWGSSRVARRYGLNYFAPLPPRAELLGRSRTKVMYVHRRCAQATRTRACPARGRSSRISPRVVFFEPSINLRTKISQFDLDPVWLITRREDFL